MSSQEPLSKEMLVVHLFNCAVGKQRRTLLFPCHRTRRAPRYFQ